jgi:hypothetical protein
MVYLAQIITVILEGWFKEYPFCNAMHDVIGTLTQGAGGEVEKGMEVS